ncbi:MAG: hypothetical protein V4596_07410 [Bdellovibrionota bacterium]
MRNILRCTLATIVAVLFLIGCLPAEAGAFGRKKKEVQEEETSTQSLNPPKAANTDEMLKVLVEKVSANFNQLNLLMSQQQYEAAMTLAKQSLDEARIKTGLDPKSNRKEIIAVPKDTFSAEYDRLGKKLSSFSVHTQNQVMKAIEEHRSGYFLDLLNLLKRTNLVYIQAFHQALKRGSFGLLSEDKEKIRNDINAVRAIPLYLQDPNSKSLLLVFDYEVANSDQNYMFNRELKTYLLSQGQDLGYTGESLEQRIDAELDQKIQSVIKSFLSTESKDVELDASYRLCVTTYYNDGYKSEESIKNQCSSVFKRINFSNQAFMKCFGDQWNGYGSDREKTVIECQYLATY